jgi:spermidine/putrescine-binding protein
MAKKRAKGFTSETQANLINGEVLAAHAYSVDGLMSSAQTKGAIQYVIPDEGCTLWIDNLVIPQGAKNVEGAHKLINHLLDAQVGVARAKALFSAPANKDSMALLPQELKDNQGLFPKPEQLAKCEMLEDLGETLTTWDRIWTEVKAGQ